MRKGELQHKIKVHRDGGTTKPLLPKGLARMTHAELVREASVRGISTEDPTKRYQVKVREQLISDIKSYEEAAVHITPPGDPVFPDTGEEDFAMEEMAANAASWPQPGRSSGASSQSSARQAPSPKEAMKFMEMCHNKPKMFEKMVEIFRRA